MTLEELLEQISKDADQHGYNIRLFKSIKEDVPNGLIVIYDEPSDVEMFALHDWTEFIKKVQDAVEQDLYEGFMDGFWAMIREHKIARLV